jgi:hypothetical protein
VQVELLAEEPVAGATNKVVAQVRTPLLATLLFQVGRGVLGLDLVVQVAPAVLHRQMESLAAKVEHLMRVQVVQVTLSRLPDLPFVSVLAAAAGQTPVATLVGQVVVDHVPQRVNSAVEPPVEMPWQTASQHRTR